MINLEFLRLAWETIRSHKLRSFLTLLGIIIGVFAIIVAVTAVQVIRSTAVNAVESFGATTFTVESRTSFVQSGARVRARQNLTYDQMREYVERARIPEAVSPQMFLSGNVEARYADRKTEHVVSRIGVNEHWLDNNGFDLARGRNVTDLDVQLDRAVAVIGFELDDFLFPSENALGKEIIVGGRRYEVIGVLAEKGDVFGQNMDRLALVPITRMISESSAAHRDISFKVRTASMNSIDEAMEETIGILRVLRGVGPGEPNNFEIESNESFVDEITQVTGNIAIGGAAIGLITLLAAGIGVMNIMLVSVAERTREIGIRKAVGAKRRDVLAQFLYEALFLCQIGGIAGILVGVLGGNVIRIYFETPFVFPWLWAVGAVLAVTGVALGFGVYPAYKAAGLDPIEALRHE